MSTFLADTCVESRLPSSVVSVLTLQITNKTQLSFFVLLSRSKKLALRLPNLPLNISTHCRSSDIVYSNIKTIHTHLYASLLLLKLNLAIRDQ